MSYKTYIEHIEQARHRVSTETYQLLWLFKKLGVLRALFVTTQEPGLSTPGEHSPLQP